jgi:putative peptidoglycan lipid II flippase
VSSEAAAGGESSAGTLRASGSMALGTLASRITGVLRDTALAAAIGVGSFADTFNVANTIPNVLYILFVGGVLNAVFVPQLVRRRKDADGGTGYTDRLLTVTGLALVVVTVVAVVAAPLVVDLLGHNFSRADHHVAVTFARYCLPQILFYGVFTVLQQVLNARGSFAPAMFAPILNNVVVLATAAMFIAVVGSHPTSTSITSGQQALLGIGSTLGIVVQALVLIPVVRRTGYHFSPKFDLRGYGLGQAWTLARWTLALVAVNQAAYIVVGNLAVAANKAAEAAGATQGGFSSYQRASLIFVLPHSIVTISLVTALLPRMSRSAVDGDLRGMARDLTSGLRTAWALIVPAAVAFAALGPQITQLLFGYGATDPTEARYIGEVLRTMSLGLIPFTVFFVLLRGFYAREDTRTPFWLNVLLSAVNVALALTLYEITPDSAKVPALGGAYALSYLVAALVIWRVLSRRVGGLDTFRTVRTLVRLVVASAVAVVPTLVVSFAVHAALGDDWASALVAVVVGLPVGALAYGRVASRMRVEELTAVTSMVRGRVRRG